MYKGLFFGSFLLFLCGGGVCQFFVFFFSMSVCVYNVLCDVFVNVAVSFVVFFIGIFLSSSLSSVLCVVLLVLLFVVGVFLMISMNLLCCWFVLLVSQFCFLVRVFWNNCLCSLVSLCVISSWCVGLNVLVSVVMVLVIWCGVLQNISVYGCDISVCSVFVCCFVFGGRKFVNVNVLVQLLVMLSVVMVVFVLGSGIIVKLVVCMVLMSCVLGFEMFGVLVFDIQVMCLLLCSSLIMCCVVLCLLCLCMVMSGFEILQWVSSWFVLWVFLVVMWLVRLSMCSVCSVMLVVLLIGVVIMQSVVFGQCCVCVSLRRVVMVGNVCNCGMSGIRMVLCYVVLVWLEGVCGWLCLGDNFFGVV